MSLVNGFANQNPEIVSFRPRDLTITESALTMKLRFVIPALYTYLSTKKSAPSSSLEEGKREAPVTLEEVLAK